MIYIEKTLYRWKYKEEVRKITNVRKKHSGLGKNHRKNYIYEYIIKVITE